MPCSANSLSLARTWQRVQMPCPPHTESRPATRRRTATRSSVPREPAAAFRGDEDDEQVASHRYGRP